MAKRKLKHVIGVEDPEFNSFPVRIMVTLVDIPAIRTIEPTIVYSDIHQFLMTIPESYPYEKPIVEWQTPIFHPNIMDPKDGGKVCTKLLNDWRFSSNLLTFIQGIESLLANPNPMSPFGTDSCTRAAEYYNIHRLQLRETLTRAPKIIR
jgi:ubiquitin-protein ligase